MPLIEEHGAPDRLLAKRGSNFATLAKAIVFQACRILCICAVPLTLAVAGPLNCVLTCAVPPPLPPTAPRAVPQQLATTAAAKIYGRVLEACGCTDALDPASVAAAPLAELRGAGLSERKASYIQDLARHFQDGRLTDAKIAGGAGVHWGCTLTRALP